MIDEQVTGFSGVPSTYAHLLHQSPLAASSDRLTSLRYCSQAGGHMAGSIKLKLLDILPEHAKLFVMYGATEASARLAYVEPEMLSEKLESIGKPIPGVSLRIISADGQQLPVGEIGEIVASGANITVVTGKIQKLQAGSLMTTAIIPVIWDTRMKMGISLSSDARIIN